MFWWLESNAPGQLRLSGRALLELNLSCLDDYPPFANSQKILTLCFFIVHIVCITAMRSFYICVSCTMFISHMTVFVPCHFSDSCPYPGLYSCCCLFILISILSLSMLVMLILLEWHSHCNGNGLCLIIDHTATLCLSVNVDH